MTTYSSNHQFPIPEDGQLDWDDEIRETLTSIDTLLKGIDEDSITKNTINTDAVSISTSFSLGDGDPLVLGDDNDFRAQYDSASGKTLLQDNSLTSPTNFLELTHGSDGPITTQRPLQDTNANAYATEAYADAKASVSGEDITPASVNTDSYNGIRMLSSFMDSTTPLQDAVDWSDANGPVFIDGQYETDEGTVELPNRSVLFGMGPYQSRIITTASTTDPLFVYVGGEDGDPNTATQWSNFQVVNNGHSERPFFKENPGSTALNFSDDRTYWQNLRITDFGGIYPIDITQLWGGTFDNIVCRTANSNPTGHFRFQGCNACQFSNIKSMHCLSADSETPAIYIDGCSGTHFNTPHVEFTRTDAAIQIAGSGSTVVITSPHIEPHYNDSYPTIDINCGIQIGDGGITDGNTEGQNQVGPEVTIIGGVMHGPVASLPVEGIRILNNNISSIQGLVVGEANGWDYLNYGGSNHDTQSNLSTSAGKITISGSAVGERIIKSANTPNPDIHIQNGTTFYSETNATNQMAKYETAYIDNSTGVRSLAMKDDSGTIHVWDPDRTL